MKIKWDSSYSVHVSELDQQHQHLIELVENIEEMSKSSNYKELINTVYDELMEYVAVHFHTEEEYMESAGYANTEAHKKRHQEMAQDMNDRVNEILAHEVTALDLVKVHNFLLDWINKHILEDDKAYVTALKEMHDV
jgi:hemerythrin-like metal-binding protein